jgi:hypothetical protein
VLPSGQKLTSGLLAGITLEVVPFRAYAPSLVLLPFLNASCKSCSVRVFSTACDSASITSIVSKWRAAFPFYLQSEKERKLESVVDDSHVFRQKFPGEIGSVRLCVVVMQQPVLSHKFGAKSSHIFMRSP